MTALLRLWAHPDEPDTSVGEVLHWCRYTDGLEGTSIPRYLEDHAERLRARYLEFINDLGEHIIGGRHIVEHLDLGDGISFWWMTLLAEKSPFKSPRIFDCLRLMALEEIVVAARPARLVLYGADRNLSIAVSKLCRNLKIDFVWHPAPARKRWALRDAYLALPHTLQGIISLRHLAMKWPLRKLKKPRWFSGRTAVFFCSYFFHLDPDAGAAGRFRPRQWEGLPEHLYLRRTQANWIHHYLRGPEESHLQTSLHWLGLFNNDSVVQGCHSFLETYMSWRLLWRALWRWVRLNTVALRLRRIDVAFRPKGSAVCLWPLLRKDWYASLQGSVAMNNCLWVELFDAAFGSLPRQETGLYLWENQGWECAMLHAWRRHGHGRIIGVPHATVVFWHLNNFDDPRSLASRERCEKPLPDRLAINGPMARRAFVSAGSSADRFVEVEALRFQYLAEASSTKATVGRVGEAGPARFASAKLSKILVLGDFTLRQTLKMLRCLEQAFLLSQMEFSVTLKPHPACRIAKEDYPSLAFEQTSLQLPQLWPHCDLVFSSNTTSAGLEALLVGLPVVVFLDQDDFNHSPLRGIAGIQFAANARDLVAALEYAEPCVPPPALEDFFWLDRKLPRWSQLLSQAADEAR